MVTVRLATESDLALLVQLAAAFRDFLEQQAPVDTVFAEDIALLLRDQWTDFILAVSSDGQPLGYVQSRYRHSAWASGLEVELEDVFVVPDARRMGVGYQLVECAISRAKERGCRLMGLNTNERNHAAVALYNALGFTAEGVFWKGGRMLWLRKFLDRE